MTVEDENRVGVLNTTFTRAHAEGYAAGHAAGQREASLLGTHPANKVEKIARAIRDAFPHMMAGSRPKPAWDRLSESDRETWRRMALAAIMAEAAIRAACFLPIIEEPKP